MKRLLLTFFIIASLILPIQGNADITKFGGFLPCTSDNGTLCTTSRIISSPQAIVTHSATESTTASYMYGHLHKITGAYTVTLPAAVVGMTAIFRASTAAAFSVKAGSSDHFEMYDGTVMTAGNKLTSGGTKNEFITIVCESANTWIVIGQNGIFTDGGA